MKKIKMIIYYAAAFVVFSVLAAGCDTAMSSLEGKTGGSRISVPTGYIATIAPESESFELLAGKTIPAGEVTAGIDGTNLVVTYSASYGFILNEVHLWIGESKDGIPVNKSGNPVPGNFPYTATGLSTAQYSLTIPLEEIGVEYVEGMSADDAITGKFYGAAHAVVSRLLSSGSTQKETAWAGVDRITAKGNWATYFSFLIDFVKPGKKIETEYHNPQTAYAVGDLTFIGTGIGQKWGWIITVNSSGSTPLYAGAAQNNLSKGTLVGRVEYSLSGSKLEVKFILDDGYGMDETHVYASELFPVDTAPGQYGNIHDFSPYYVTSDSYSVEVGGLPVYLIAHAVVSEEVE